MEDEVIIPNMENSFEKFDIADFQRNVDSITGKRIIVKDDLYIQEDYQDPGFSRLIYDYNSSFYSLKLYFENGNIQEKGVAFNNGSDYGTWYHFSENGDFVKEEDTDLGYDFNWADVIQYCQENEIVLEKGYPKNGGIKTEIFKREDEGKKVWAISYYSKQKSQYLEVTLDGKSGEQIAIKEIEMVGN